MIIKGLKSEIITLESRNNEKLFIKIDKGEEHLATIDLSSFLNNLDIDSYRSVEVEFFNLFEWLVSVSDREKSILPMLVPTSSVDDALMSGDMQYWSIFTGDRKLRILPESSKNKPGTGECKNYEPIIFERFTDSLSVIYSRSSEESTVEKDIISSYDLSLMGINKDKLEALALNNIVNYSLRDELSTYNFEVGVGFVSNMEFGASLILCPNIVSYIKMCLGSEFVVYIPCYNKMHFVKDNCDDMFMQYAAELYFDDSSLPLSPCSLSYESGYWFDNPPFIES